jgi:hypothetical protein
LGAVVLATLVLLGLVTVPAGGADVNAPTLLGQLKVRAERETGYEREKFGGWRDFDRDGCDTRREVLFAEAKVKPDVGRGCSLAGGKWYSPYDGRTYTNPARLQIDHMVPLSEAWQSGAYRWTNTTRQRFANDLGYSRSLMAVTAGVNMSKGDRQPGEWLPPRRAYVCRYVADWIAVKWRWGLTVDSWEKANLKGLLNYCGDEATTRKPSKAKVIFRF